MVSSIGQATGLFHMDSSRDDALTDEIISKSNGTKADEAIIESGEEVPALHIGEDGGRNEHQENKAAATDGQHPQDKANHEGCGRARCR